MNEHEGKSTPIAKVVLASFVGTTIEWYDFFLYSTAAALVFNQLFFPTLDPYAGTMASLATYAVGFFARPLGAVVFGHYGDRIGRKSMLVASLMMMGLATFLMGLLPTYNHIGVWAPVLLVGLRFIQGFGVGGEWGGAVLMAVEHGHQGKRGFYASWVQAGVPVGMVLATGLLAVMKLLADDQFLDWGWRVPFLTGIVLMGVGLFIRLHIMESPLFARVQSSPNPGRLPLIEVLLSYPKSVLLSIGARFAENGSFYIFTVLIFHYATYWHGLPERMILNGVLLASVAQFVSLPIYGILSDHVGRRPIYMAGAVFLGLFAFPFFWLVDTKVPGLIWLALVLAVGVGHAAMYGPQAAFFSELFGTRVRYSGASIGYHLSAPLAGGLAPLIATALLRWSGGHPWPVAVYLIVMVVITVISVYLAGETARADLARES